MHRTDTIDTQQEFATIGHMRGWCHDSSMCALCTSSNALMAVRSDNERWRVLHRSEELRRIDAEINNAHMARELMHTQATLDSIISG